MSLTEMLDNIPDLENGMVPVYKDWERTAISLKKYFYDISVFLSVDRIKELFKMWPWVLISKDKNWMKFFIDVEMLDKRYLINQDPRWQLFQLNRYIPIPKQEIVRAAPTEKIGIPTNDKALEDRVAELERTVIRLMNKDSE